MMYGRVKGLKDRDPEGRRQMAWSTTVTEHGVSIRIYVKANSSALWADRSWTEPDPDDPDKRIRRRKRQSLDTSDRVVAEDRARRIARRVASYQINGDAPDDLTLGRLAELYLHHNADLLTERRLQSYRTALGLFRRHLSDEFLVADFGEHQAKTYTKARETGTLAAKGGKKGVSVGSIRKEMDMLSRVFNWASGYKVGGRPLLSSNPIGRGMRPSYKPHALPLVDRERFEKLLAVANDIEPRGRLRIALLLAWYTGRRIRAICHLRVSDIITGRARVQAALEADGMKGRAAIWFDGVPDDAWAVARWRAEYDKRGELWYAPLHSTVRAELESYIRRAGVVGEAWLFPADRKDGPTPDRVLYEWLRRAEKKAELPHLDKGGWHAFRRGWATRRKGLPIQDVAEAGGWGDPMVVQKIYQQSEEAGVARAVNFDD
jgi:integrase